jgi:hypothetical protein
MNTFLIIVAATYAALSLGWLVWLFIIIIRSRRRRL